LVKSTPRKRFRRSISEGADLRNRLIEAARELFVAEGYAGVSIRRITQRAGCPAMTFYLYFTSKHALLRHIWEDIFAELLPRCAAAAADHTDPVEKVEAYVTTMTRYWLDHPDSYRVVYLNQDVLEPGDETYYVESGDIVRRFQALQHLIDDGKASGRFRRDADSELVMQALSANSIGVAHALVTVPEFPWRRAELVGAGTRLILAAITVVTDAHQQAGLRPS
jgi:AcrR family transcriptional regulator